jgi:hypothetical protein
MRRSHCDSCVCLSVCRFVRGAFCLCMVDMGNLCLVGRRSGSDIKKDKKDKKGSRLDRKGSRIKH